MRLYLLMLCFLITCPVFGATNDAPRSTITLAYDVKPNPPYYFGEGVDIDWDKPGITLDEFKQIEKNLNITFKFVRRPWARCLTELKNNTIDGLFHASYKPEREAMGVYPKKNGTIDETRKAMVQSYYLYTRDDSPIKWDGQKIHYLNGSIGAIIGYSIIKDLNSLGYQVEEVATQRSNLIKLASGRIEALAGIGAMNDFQIKQHQTQFANIMRLEPPLKRKAYYLIFSHKFAETNPKLMEQIWDAILQVQASDAYPSLLKKYLQ